MRSPDTAADTAADTADAADLILSTARSFRPESFSVVDASSPVILPLSQRECLEKRVESSGGKRTTGTRYKVENDVTRHHSLTLSFEKRNILGRVSLSIAYSEQDRRRATERSLFFHLFFSPLSFSLLFSPFLFFSFTRARRPKRVSLLYLFERRSLFRKVNIDSHRLLVFYRPRIWTLRYSLRNDPTTGGIIAWA